MPRRAGYPAPNLEHLILMVLTLVTAFVTFSRVRASGGLPTNLWLNVGVVSALLGGGTFYQFVLADRSKAKTP